MDRNEILAKSREENKNRDVHEKEVLIEGGNIGAITAVVLSTIFFVVQILLGKGMNYALYAVVFSILAASFIVKAVKLKRKHEIAVAVIYVLLTILLSIGHIYYLMGTSWQF